MESSKYGWRKDNNSFERYYYNQLKRFKNATMLYDIDSITENSSLEDISTRFDDLIDVLLKKRLTGHSVIPKGVCSDIYNHPTSLGDEQKLVLEGLDKIIRKTGFLPFMKKTVDNKILVIDINYLLSEYKDADVKVTTENLELIYKCKVLLIDGSRINTQGLMNSYLPAYFI